MTDLVEYKILVGDHSECVDLLNKWKEMYNLHILNMCSHPDGVAILLLRTIPQSKEIPQ